MLNEFADVAKPLAVDACNQRRRVNRGLPAQDHAAAFVPYIHLLIDYHFGFTKRALIGAVVALFTTKVPVWLVFGLGGTVVAGHARPVRTAVPPDLRLRRKAPAAVHIHRGLTLLPEELYAYARPFRHLWLRARDRPAADPGAIDRLCAAGGAVLGPPHPGPPHSSPDVCADDRDHRAAALLSCPRAHASNAVTGIAALADGRPSVSRRAILRDGGGAAGSIRYAICGIAMPILRARICCAMSMPLPTSGIRPLSKEIAALLGTACRPTSWAYRCCAADLAAHAVVALLRRPDPRAFGPRCIVASSSPRS